MGRVHSYLQSLFLMRFWPTQTITAKLLVGIKKIAERYYTTRVLDFLSMVLYDTFICVGSDDKGFH